MGGGNTTTSTQTTGSADPVVKSTLDQLLGTSSGGLQGIFTKGPQVFNQSEYAGVSPTTTGAWNNSLAAAGNPTYAGGVQGALTDQAAKAGGQNLGVNDPTYEALRTKLMNDTLGATNASFNNSGLFGSDSNQRAAGEGVGNALAGLDYTQYQNGQQQQQQAIQNLPGLFSALQAPSATAGAVGSAMDADKQATLTGQADLFNRTQNAPLLQLQQLAGILGGSAPSAGTTTTKSQPSTPWWQSALGLGASLL